jgi:hypothetical protein
MEVHISWLAVVLATLSTMVVGSVWYARPIFGNAWMKLAKINPKKPSSNMTSAIITTLVVSFISAFVLAHFIFLAHTFFKNSLLQDALSTSFWAWLGFTATRLVTHDTFEGRPKMLTILNVLHEFITIMVMGLIIGLIK